MGMLDIFKRGSNAHASPTAHAREFEFNGIARQTNANLMNGFDPSAVQQRQHAMEIEQRLRLAEMEREFNERLATDPAFAADERKRAQLDMDTQRKNELAAKIRVNAKATLAMVDEHMKILKQYSTDALAYALARDKAMATHLALALTLAPAYEPTEKEPT